MTITGRTSIRLSAFTFLALLVLGGAGCHDWNSVELRASYGFCAGYCQHTVTLDPGASGTIVHEGFRGELPRLETAVAYPARAGELDDAVDRASSISWPDRTGCPDCVDQGAFLLTLRSGDGGTRTTLLDPLQHPAEFDPLLALFADVRLDHPPPPPPQN